MPPKPKEQVKGSGAEWYNIDFDPEILKKGAVVATAKVIKGLSLYQAQLIYYVTVQYCNKHDSLLL